MQAHKEKNVKDHLQHLSMLAGTAMQVNSFMPFGDPPHDGKYHLQSRCSMKFDAKIKER